MHKLLGAILLLSSFTTSQAFLKVSVNHEVDRLTLFW
jgi:hypothetical protein